MKSSRTTLSLALSAALVLSACNGGESADNPAGDGATDTSPATTADEASATTDAGDTVGAADDEAATTGAGEDAEATSAAPVAGEDEGDDETDEDADDDVIAMATTDGGGVMSVEEAEEIATTVLTAAAMADQGDGSDVRDYQRQAYMSTARRAAEAEDRLESVFGAPEERDLDEDPVEPNVLAISRDDGDLPHYLLVQTVPESGVPELHLMESRTGRSEHFRITWEASMLPGTELPAFHPRSEGTPVVREGQGTLLEPGRDTVRSVAAYTSYPQPEEIPDYRTHGYAPAVRQAAERQAAQVSGQANFRERNWLISDDIRTLMFEDGSAFVIGALSRKTEFSVRANSELNPPDAFKVFQNSDVLYNEAVMSTLVFVGMRVPAEGIEFKPEMIAVREQLVDASGS